MPSWWRVRAGSHQSHTHGAEPRAPSPPRPASAAPPVPLDAPQALWGDRGYCLEAPAVGLSHTLRQTRKTRQSNREVVRASLTLSLPPREQLTATGQRPKGGGVHAVMAEASISLTPVVAEHRTGSKIHSCQEWPVALAHRDAAYIGPPWQ